MASATASGAGKPITLESLLNEMIDCSAVARWPGPAYSCRQFSSYDRASVAPDKPGWFANMDMSNFLRVEEHQGRSERVMFDAQGPGCVVRAWQAATTKGIYRIYLDDSETPVITGKDMEIFGGQGEIKPPFSRCVIPTVPAAGKNLFLPIPYARRCVITWEGPNFWDTKDPTDGNYWNINYRTYEPGTRVETFSMEGLKAAQAAIDTVGRILVNPAKAKGTRVTSLDEVIQPDGQAALELGKGSASIRSLEIRLEAKDLEKALRATVLTINFDGEDTVWCPGGDWSGSGVGLNPFQDWYRTVAEDGTMTCRWVMPFERSAKITLTNLGNQDVRARLKVAVGKWNWDERSMHFHATWHYQWPFLNCPPLDWNFIKAAGQGVMVGDTLALMTNHCLWWGEGDEKIYIDGESFPSHFGTGTEDYYGYAYGAPVVFTEPFHAQPRVDLYAHMGHRTNTRCRSLDAVPFRKSLQFDIEAWGAVPNAEVAYAGTTYWYARPGATCNYGPAPELARQPIPSPYPGLPLALEAERMIAIGHTGGKTGVQKEANAGFSADAYWWTEGKPGDKAEFLIEPTGGKVDAEGKFIVPQFELWANFAKTPDGARVQIYIDGTKAGEPINLYAPKPSATGEISLGRGGNRLLIEFIGADEKAHKPLKFGLDYIKAEKLR